MQSPERGAGQTSTWHDRRALMPWLVAVFRAVLVCCVNTEETTYTILEETHI